MMACHSRPEGTVLPRFQKRVRRQELSKAPKPLALPYTEAFSPPGLALVDSLMDNNSSNTPERQLEEGVESTNVPQSLARESNCGVDAWGHEVEIRFPTS